MSARDSSDAPLGATCTPSSPTFIATMRWMGFCKVPLGPLTITEPPDMVTSVFWGTGIGLLARRLMFVICDLLFDFFEIYQISKRASPPTRSLRASAPDMTPLGVERTKRPWPCLMGRTSRTLRYMRRLGLEMRLTPVMTGAPFLYESGITSEWFFFSALPT